MTNDEEDKEGEELKEKEVKRFNKSKDIILDESFKKAELLKKDQPKKKEVQIVAKKPFIKLGIFITLIAIIGLVSINFLPLVYINYETDYGSIEEYFSYEDFRYNIIEPEEINSLFESTCYNCSDNSDTYIGLTFNDLTNTPKLTIYIFIFLALIGIIFTIFILFDRKKDFSEETITIIHSFFIAFIITIGIILLFINIKFLGAHLLFQLNKPFIQALGFNKIKMFFFSTYISILLSFFFFIIGLVFMRINLNKAVNKFNVDKSKKSNLNYRFWSNI